MNRPTVNRMQSAVMPLRQIMFLGMALLITLAAGQFYYSWQTAKLTEQVAVQTARLVQIKAMHASNQQLQAARPLPASDTEPAVVETVEPQERWVF